MRLFCYLRSVSILWLAGISGLHAQDLRHVEEPHIPAACVVLHARLVQFTASCRQRLNGIWIPSASSRPWTIAPSATRSCSSQTEPSRLFSPVL
jgi:hypothetical protein